MAPVSWRERRPPTRHPSDQVSDTALLRLNGERRTYIVKAVLVIILVVIKVIEVIIFIVAFVFEGLAGEVVDSTGNDLRRQVSTKRIVSHE